MERMIYWSCLGFARMGVWCWRVAWWLLRMAPRMAWAALGAAFKGL